MKREMRLFGSILTLVVGFVLARVASGQTTATIDARLRGNADGSVTVRFRAMAPKSGWIGRDRFITSS